MSAMEKAQAKLLEVAVKAMVERPDVQAKIVETCEMASTLNMRLLEMEARHERIETLLLDALTQLRIVNMRAAGYTHEQIAFFEPSAEVDDNGNRHDG